MQKHHHLSVGQWLNPIFSHREANACFSTNVPQNGHAIHQFLQWLSWIPLKLWCISSCFKWSRCTKVNMQRFEKQIGLRNCAFASSHFQLQTASCISLKSVSQFIAALSSYGPISCLMILLMGVYLHLPHIMTNTAIHWHLGDRRQMELWKTSIAQRLIA